MNEAAPQNRRAVSWIYKVEGEFAQDEDIPPEAIAGAWPVDEAGELAGDFIVNPRYVPMGEEDAPPPLASGWVKG
jgi:hypothetical protein